jgi:hypothetical protein
MVWVVALLAYVAFLAWYQNWRRPVEGRGVDEQRPVRR